MIKGVNKRIIEINEYDSKTFEKAILFLKPNVKNINEITLKNEAKKYLNNLETNKLNSDSTRKRRKLIIIKNRIVFSVIGAIFGAVFFILLNIII